MIVNCTAVLVIAVLLGTSAPAEEIPPHRRIEAEIVRVIAAPAKQPMHMPTDVAVDHAGRDSRSGEAAHAHAH